MNDSEELLFTPAALLDLLSKIDELQDVDVGITETIDGKVQLVVGDSVYEIEDNNATDIQVDEEVIDEVAETNEDAYDDMVDSQEVEYEEEAVESGIIKEAAKSLLVGGLVRLGVKALK